MARWRRTRRCAWRCKLRARSNGAPARHPASRPEAGEHPRDARTATAKLLDFGLAKLMGAGRAGRDADDGRHRLGTAAYMSPEQAAGQAARRAVRHLQLRRHAVRDAVGRARVSAAHDRAGPECRAARRPSAAPGVARAGRIVTPLSREVAGAAVSDDGRGAGRAGAGRREAGATSSRRSPCCRSRT